LDAADEVRKTMQKKDEKEEEESAPMDVDDEFKTVAPRPVQVSLLFPSLYVYLFFSLSALALI
jgi:hypothetical protein